MNHITTVDAGNEVPNTFIHRRMNRSFESETHGLRVVCPRVSTTVIVTALQHWSMNVMRHAEFVRSQGLKGCLVIEIHRSKKLG